MNKKFLYIILIVLLAFTSFGEEQQSSFDNSVFYEIFVRSFYDTSGNGVGDINGVTAKLDYIASLGVKGIWLMPVFYSSSPHGYDISNYYEINPVYGTEEDLIRLFDEAKKRGITIILDLVINHTSRYVEWFKKSVERDPIYDDYYVWSKDKPEGKWLSWTYNKKRDEWYFSSFGSGMPDLNFNNPLVREEVKKIAEYWLNKGAGGFRLDAAKHIIEDGPGDLQKDTQGTVEWWNEFSAFIKTINKDALVIGEVWSSTEGISRYYQEGKGLSKCFDFDLSGALLKAAARSNLSGVKENILKKQELGVPYNFFAPFLSNHDTVRTMNILKNDFGKAKAAAVLLLTSPGTPFVYYGEEIGMYQTQTGKGDNGKRTVMQWSNNKTAGFTNFRQIRHDVSDFANPFNVAFQEKRKDSLLNLYRRLIALRNERPELRSADYKFFENDNNLICYEKTFNDKKIIVLINTSDKYVLLNDLVIAGTYYDLITEKKIVFLKNQKIKPATVYLLTN